MVEKKVERRPVKDYEGYYEVDENGNVYSLDRIVRVVDGARVYDKPLKGKRLTPIKKNNGYLSVSLTRDGRHKGAYIHRIVAEAFLENPNNYNCINHKDEDRTNDCVGNLEWCSYSYNSMYNDSAKKRGSKYRGKASPNRKMITAFGDTKSRLEWAKESGIAPDTIRRRIKMGWSPEEAVTRPLCKSRFERVKEEIWWERK